MHREQNAKREEFVMPEYFVLTRDNDSHWYVIPADKQSEWDDWCSIPSDDERSWTPPAFAKATGGSPSLVRFSDFYIE